MYRSGHVGYRADKKALENKQEGRRNANATMDVRRYKAREKMSSEVVCDETSTV